jgi:hypothetical protein
MDRVVIAVAAALSRLRQIVRALKMIARQKEKRNSAA